MSRYLPEPRRDKYIMSAHIGCALLVVLLGLASGTVLDSHETDVPLFRHALEVVRDHSQLAGEGLEKLFPDHLDQIREFMEAIRNDESLACQTCELAAGLLQALTFNRTWESLEEPIVDLCIVLLNVTGLRGDIMCPGIIALQGPHVFTIAQHMNITPTRLCETLNMCFPEPEEIHVKNEHTSHRFPSPELLQKLKLRTKRNKKSATTRGQHRNQEEALRVVQLTDIHIDPHYQEGTSTECGVVVCCRPTYGPGDAGLYGDYRCNIPTRTMELVFDKVAELDPHFIIYSGDTPPHHMWEETLESQLNCTATLIETLHRKLSNYNIYPNIGNHEMYPTNLYYLDLESTRTMNDKFAEWWTPFANFTADHVTTMKKAGYYAITALPGLRILSFNTNFWYTMNFYNALNIDRQEMAEMHTFMEQTLMDAKDNGEKVLLIGHHPPGRSDSLLRPSRWFRTLVRDYHDVIILHVAGHTHNDHYKLMSAPGESEALSVVHVAASVTSYSYINPSMRVFQLDPDTYELLDYDQYYVDLMEAQVRGMAPEMKKAYNAREEYGMSDLSVASWQDLANRMDSDSELLHKYHLNNNARVDPDRTCDDICKQDHLCGIRHSVYDEYLECVSAEPVSLASGATCALSMDGKAAVLLLLLQTLVYSQQ